MEAELAELRRANADLLCRIAELEAAAGSPPRPSDSESESESKSKSKSTSKSTSKSDGPESGLKGMRVLDLSRVLAGPFCSMLLADLGAEVIKLERPRTGDDSRQFPPFVGDTSLYYVNLNRGKRSVAIDLKTPGGRAVFERLAAVSDVVLENYSPGTMERLGLGYDRLHAINPALVFVSISGFGQTGELRERPGYDIIAQAMSGLMSITGWPDSPPTRAGTAVGDIMAALFTAVGILAALQVRARTGVGQRVDIALVDALFSSMGQHLQKIFAEGASPGRIGNRYEFIAPYDSFHAADGWVVIAIANDELWHRFLRALEGDADAPGELLEDCFHTNALRLANHDRLKVLVERWTCRKSVQDIVDRLLLHRIPSCPIVSLADAAVGHLATDRAMVVEVDQPRVGPVRLLGNALKMSRTDTRPVRPAPELGQDTAAVLRDLLDMPDEAIEALKRDRAVFTFDPAEVTKHPQ